MGAGIKKTHMKDKEYTSKQVLILVGAIISAIAFLETSGPMWTWTFWRQFLLNLLVYGGVSVVIIIDLVVKIFLTSGLTIVGGVFIFVFGQILSKFFIEPLHEQRKAIGAVGEALIFFQEVYEKQLVAGEEIKKLMMLYDGVAVNY
jgi:hypothetical protein